MCLLRKAKRRKRIPYDPPGRKSRIRARRKANRRAETLFITRRVLIFKSGIVAAFSILLARLGYMQIGKGDEWSAMATTNRTEWRELKPTRGLIVDRQGRVMAGNRKSWSVSDILADIRQLPTESLEYVKEQLVTALRLPNVVMVNPGSIPKDAKDQVYRRLGVLLGDESDEEFDQTSDWIRANPDTTLTHGSRSFPLSTSLKSLLLSSSNPEAKVPSTRSRSPTRPTVHISNW